MGVKEYNHSMIRLKQVNKDLSCMSFVAIKFNLKTITNIENQPEALVTNLKPLLQTLSPCYKPPSPIKIR